MKIRLAKHTRALAAALAFCVLSAVPAYAQEDDTVEVPGGLYPPRFPRPPAASSLRAKHPWTTPFSKR